MEQISLLETNSHNADDIPTVISTIRVSIEFVFKSKILTHSKILRSITDNMSNTTNKILILPRATNISEEGVICLIKLTRSQKMSTIQLRFVLLLVGSYRNISKFLFIKLFRKSIKSIKKNKRGERGFLVLLYSFSL